MPVQFEDYYKTLGVARDAAADEVKRAYRKLAQTWHPDRNNEPEAAERFSKINEAYEVLKDPEKRKKYDELGADWKAGQEFRPPPGYGSGGGGFGGFRHRGGGAGGQAFEFEGGDFSDFFREVFGRHASAGHGRRGATAGGTPGGGYEDLFGGGGFAQEPPEQQAEITVSLHEAYHGTTRQLGLQTPTGTKTLDVKIPAGIKPGGKVRLKGEHLVLKVNVADDPRFERGGASGNDLTVDVPVTPATAALGGKADVPTLDGDITLNIPPGTSSGQRLRVRGKGLADGDMFARVKITVPKEPTDEQRALYEQLRDLD